jgi:urea transporter
MSAVTTGRAAWTGRGAAALRAQLAAVGETFFVGRWETGAAAAVVVGCVAPLAGAAGLACGLATRAVAERMGANQELLDGRAAELNGWFAGLALASIFAPSVGLAAALVAAPLVGATATIALQRVLRAWELPLMVAAYLPTVWLAWLALAGTTTAPVLPAPALDAAAAARTLLPAWAEGASAAQLGLRATLGGLRGVGQIFFQADAGVGALLVGVVALTASVADAVWLLGAAVAATAVGLVLGIEPWMVDQGLVAFTPALVATAARRNFRGLGVWQVGAAVLVGPLVEAATVRVAGALGGLALSTGYLALVWAMLLAAPKRRMAVVPAGLGRRTFG